MHQSYSHEVSSAASGQATGRLHRSSTAMRSPPRSGFAAARVSPAEATYSEQLAEFVLPYDAIRPSTEADAALREFLETTYAAAADAGAWNRELLEEQPLCACDVRTP